MRHPFDKHYFHGGGSVGGYAGSGYRDFPAHWITYAHVMKRAPSSVLELGCGRGYLLKRFAQYAKIPVTGLEISEHCYLTRAIDGIVTHDVTKTPWPVSEPLDLCLSVAFLEHVPEPDLPAVFAEMARATQRGLHGIDLHEGDGFDQTHCTIRPLAWWKERLPPGHEAVDKESLEIGPLDLPPDIDHGIKLNLGSFTQMFHGWRNLDRIDLYPWARANHYRFVLCDLADGLNYDDGIVDAIVMSHVLEHFEYNAGGRLIAECRRVLKPGGVLRVAVPDADRIVALYQTGELEQLRELCGKDLVGALPIVFLNELLYGGDHRAIYNRAALVDALGRAGFSRVTPSRFNASENLAIRRETIDLYPDMSLFVEATA